MGSPLSSAFALLPPGLWRNDHYCSLVYFSKTALGFHEATDGSDILNGHGCRSISPRVARITSRTQAGESIKVVHFHFNQSVSPSRLRFSIPSVSQARWRCAAKPLWENGKWGCGVTAHQPEGKAFYHTRRVHPLALSDSLRLLCRPATVMAVEGGHGSTFAR